MEAEKRIKDINEAYDILSNEDNRRNYDRENEPQEEFKQNNFQYNPFNCRSPNYNETNPHRPNYFVNNYSGKRHNQRCKYYNNCAGHFSDNPHEGIPCFICGG